MGGIVYVNNEDRYASFYVCVCAWNDNGGSKILRTGANRATEMKGKIKKSITDRLCWSM